MNRGAEYFAIVMCIAFVLLVVFGLLSQWGNVQPDYTPSRVEQAIIEACE